MAVQSKAAFPGFLPVDVPCDLVLARSVYTDMVEELPASLFLLLVKWAEDAAAGAGGATWHDELDREVGAITTGKRLEEAGLPDLSTALKTRWGLKMACPPKLMPES